MAPAPDFYARHSDGTIRRYDNGHWTLMDSASKNVGFSVAGGVFYLLHNDGSIYRSKKDLSNWTANRPDNFDGIDVAGSKNVEIWADGPDFYARHSDGTIRRYDNGHWTLMDSASKNVGFSVAGGVFYLLHNDGSIYRSKKDLSNWTANRPDNFDGIDVAGSKNVEIWADGPDFYARHSDGTIRRYDNGHWTLMDSASKNVGFSVAGGVFYLLHNDGSIYRSKKDLSNWTANRPDNFDGIDVAGSKNVEIWATVASPCGSYDDTIHIAASSHNSIEWSSCVNVGSAEQVSLTFTPSGNIYSADIGVRITSRTSNSSPQVVEYEGGFGGNSYFNAKQELKLLRIPTGRQKLFTYTITLSKWHKYGREGNNEYPIVEPTSQLWQCNGTGQRTASVGYHDVVEPDYVGMGRIAFEWNGHSSYETKDRGHGREETRSYSILIDPPEFTAPGWTDVRVIGMCGRERVCKGETSHELVYFIGSRKASAKVYGKALRNHWGIENGLHWLLDTSFAEDNNRVSKRRGAENLSVVRRLALSLLKQHPDKRSIACKRLRAALEPGFLQEVLGVDGDPGKV